jgi:ATP-dependent exoDNAse (exonuclease V) beta subunit
VLDEHAASELVSLAFDGALEELAGEEAGRELIASYRLADLRAAIVGVYERLRSAGSGDPVLPAAPATPDLAPLRGRLLRRCEALAAELAGVLSPGVKVVQALERLGVCETMIASGAVPWPADLCELELPRGNGAALDTEACAAYTEALGAFRVGCESVAAAPVIGLLDLLLRGFGLRYAALKRAAGALDFEDLELMTRDLLVRDLEVRSRYRERFAQIMVDELQDTNRVQLQLIETIASGNLFTVGDALQSIYGFRHAEVELFERRRRELSARGEHATLATNFRSRREILDALNIAFCEEFGEGFTPLVAGRVDAPALEPLVELLIAEKGADWRYAQEGVAAPWRIAEARALAGRVCGLVAGGVACRDVVVLTRATTDIRAYERALEERGVPTYVIGGRGYWAHPQVIDLVAYLRALANPRDEEALFTVLASPFVGVSDDGLVLLGAAARSGGVDPWAVLASRTAVDDVSAGDRERLSAFASWFADEREAAARVPVDALIERALVASGYDLEMLRMPGGERRMANVRKLMRLAREHARVVGPDLWAFVDAVRGRAGLDDDEGVEARESEAPVEGEALDAVRLMTIHRAKGLEFPVVCVADLGRGPRWGSELLRVGLDGRIGVKLARPGTGRAEPALEYKALGEESALRDAREERRLFFVAMTRARERLVLSGAARFDRWMEPPGSGAIGWIAPAFVPDIAVLLAGSEDNGVVDRALEGWRASVAWRRVRPGASLAESAGVGSGEARTSKPPEAAPLSELPAVAVAAPPGVASLSYSALQEFENCGYRFYLERVAGVPGVVEARPGAALGWGAGATSWNAVERGVVVHSLLEALDFRVPSRPSKAAVVAAARASGVAPPGPQDLARVAGTVEAFAGSELCRRLARASAVRRETPFGFLLDGVLVSGVFDVVAREQPGSLLVVDYKTGGSHDYSLQRLVYALAGLESGVDTVEVVHAFLEQAADPVSAVFAAADAEALRASLSGRAAGVVAGRFEVAASPCRALCAGCPGEGGLCSWPVELTRRESLDTLF